MMFPTSEEIRRWMTDVTRHAYHIEYYLQRLQVGIADIQRPHDIVGLGNKFEWACIRGFALQYRGPVFFEEYVKPSLYHHRKQHHHCAWNTFQPTSSVDAMKLGAVDACCSLLEPRDYQGGCHTYEKVREVALGNPIHKTPWMLLMASEMEAVEQPDISDITLKSVPKLGITPESHDIITGRVDETIRMLRQDHDIKMEDV